LAALPLPGSPASEDESQSCRPKRRPRGRPVFSPGRLSVVFPIQWALIPRGDRVLVLLFTQPADRLGSES
jgi:hypothetical protein